MPRDQEQSERAADESAIRALYQQTMDGWNQGSGAAFVAPMTDDVDFVAFDGTRFKGRDELAAFQDPLFKTHLRGTRLVGDVTAIRFLAPDIALFHARGGTILRGQTVAAPERDSIQTMVAIKQGGRWTLAAFQNTRIRPIGRSFAGTMLWLLTDLLWRIVGPEA